jgi:hypothetical protein
MPDLSDTIAAEATPPGRVARGAPHRGAVAPPFGACLRQAVTPSPREGYPLLGGTSPFPRSPSTAPTHQMGLHNA